MPCTIVVGTQWGDEGKGKVIDLLAADADVVVRYQGGANAGHTVHVGSEQYIFHLVPCGILHEGKVNVIGNGVVVDPVELVEEIDGLERRGLKVAGRLFMSELAHVTLSYHKRMDEAREARRGDGKIGTTHRGIGPTYSDKFGRIGIRMGDFLDEEGFAEKVRANLEEKNTFFRGYFGVPEISEREVIETCRAVRPRIEKMVTDTVSMLRDAIMKERKVMLEGAQGTLLDVDFGTYPYVTASNPTAGGACTGSGVPPTAITDVIGVAKAYTTRVGAGPLPSALPAGDEERLRIQGREYGATTGRPRRCGWFDAVAVRRAVAVNGLTGLAVTKLDVLD
jgi:adenylosuccinate synthase